MRKAGILTFCLLFSAAVATAQSHAEPKKVLSPAATAKATIGGGTITIDYSAPSKRERAIMGALVPWGKLWRTGANAATTLTTDRDLMIGSLHVPAGKYTLFTIPNEKEWTLVVSTQSGLWGTGGYDEAKDLGRVAMTVKPVPETVETFTMGLAPSGANGTLSMKWENTEATVPVMVH
jgi:hypothetical protein